MPYIDLPTPKRNPTIQELAETVGKMSEQLGYLLNGFLGSMNIKELTADKIEAGVLLAQLVTILSNLNNGASIKIDGTGMKVNDGTKDVLTIDMDGKLTITDSEFILNLLNGFIKFDEHGMTINDGLKDTFKVGPDGIPIMTGGKVQSSESSYPRVEFDLINGFFSAMQAVNNFIKILPSGDSSAPGIVFQSGSRVVTQLLDAILDEFTMITTAGYRLVSSKDISLVPSDNLRIPAWNKVYSYGDSETLQSALNEKADGSGISGTVYVATTPGGTANTAITFSNGVRVF